MQQAKVLTGAEGKRLLSVIANDRHSERTRLAVILSFLAGLRVGEIAALKVSDVVDGEGRVSPSYIPRLRLASLAPVPVEQEQREHKHDRQRLHGDARAHQLVAPFAVERAALGHGDDAGQQHGERGNERDDDECGQDVVHGRRYSAPAAPGPAASRAQPV